MFKKLKNNNKGEIYFARIVCYLILIVCIAFMLDVVVMLTQNVVTSYQAAYYAEKVSIQGGILGQEAKFPGPSAKPCTSCLVNSDFSEDISKTFGYFGISPDDWQASITDSNDLQYFIHVRGNSTRTRFTFNYMQVGTFNLTTEFTPRFAPWIWGSRQYLISKSVPFVVEQIPS